MMDWKEVEAAVWKTGRVGMRVGLESWAGLDIKRPSRGLGRVGLQLGGWVGAGQIQKRTGRGPSSSFLDLDIWYLIFASCCHLGFFLKFFSFPEMFWIWKNQWSGIPFTWTKSSRPKWRSRALVQEIKSAVSCTHFRMSVGSANLSLLDEVVLEDFEVFTFRDAVNVTAYMVMSAG